MEKKSRRILVISLIFRFLFPLILVLMPAFLKAQNVNMNLLKGIITDTVFCISNSSESYSLFLPGNYEESKEWPVLLIFDPAARGRIAIEKFVPAGKKFGYILACSNNVQNEVFSKMLAHAEIMYHDVIQRFNIDDRRIFTAGFSGGSRLALAFSINNKKITGVIGCGAGMPNVRYYRPSLMSHLIYFGIVGNKDMNYQEMNDLSLLLSNSGILSYFIIFNGGHEWPSSQNLQFAFGWIELQMMKKGIIPKRSDFLNDFSMQMISAAKESEEKSDLVAAKKYYSYVLRDFPESPVREELLANLGKIEKSEPYKRGLRNREKIHDEESLNREKYQKAFSYIALNNKLTDSINIWWKSEINTLYSKTGKNRSSDSLLAYRLINMITIASVERGINFISTGRYKIAASFFKIWTICEPDKKNSWYNLARAYAMDGQRNEAIFALNRSIRNGLRNKDLIIHDTALVNILHEKKFTKLIIKMN